MKIIITEEQLHNLIPPSVKRRMTDKDFGILDGIIDNNKSIFNINYIYIYYYNIYYYYYNIKLLYLKYLIRFSEIKTLKVNSWEEGTFLIFDFAVKLIIGILILQFLLINNI